MTALAPRSRIGQPRSRVEGPLKVTGRARYTGDMRAERYAFAVIVGGTIPAGEITSLDISAAEMAPGVIKVFTHSNASRFGLLDQGPGGLKHLPLQNTTILYEGQPIAVVVGETFEETTYAASLVKASYRPAPFETDFRRKLGDREGSVHPEPKNVLSVEGYFSNDTRVGDVDTALKTAPVKIEQTYRTSDRHHNPMEPSASLAEWRDDKLTQIDAVQGVVVARAQLAKAFAIDPKDVRVRSEFVGGGFGCKGYLWPHQALCAMAARELKRPVKLVLPRAQDFTDHGYQPATEQTISLGAERDGTLIALRHTTINPTPINEDYVEACATASRALYKTPNLETHMRIVRVNRNIGTPMRAPHEGPGLVALEIAMDELAYELGVDPLALRLKNYAEKDPTDGRPFSAKFLRECYAEGARRFGWSKREMPPRSMSQGSKLIGWGMASAIMETFRNPAKARITIDRQGAVLVEGSTQEIGTGAVTVISQTAADALGLPLERVHLQWADTDLPEAPMPAGSTTTLSFGSAVHEAATQLKEKLNGLTRSKSLAPEHYGELLTKNNLEKLSAEGAWAPRNSDQLGQPKDYSIYSYGALFVEVQVDRELMIPRVTRGVGVFNAGRIINHKTARGQALGGFAWGLGHALLEASEIDHKIGRYVSKDLVGYDVAVNADIPVLDMSFIDEPDYQSSPIGARDGRTHCHRCRPGDRQRNFPRHRQTRSRAANYSGQADPTMARSFRNSAAQLLRGAQAARPSMPVARRHPNAEAIGSLRGASNVIARPGKVRFGEPPKPTGEPPVLPGAGFTRPFERLNLFFTPII